MSELPEDLESLGREELIQRVEELSHKLAQLEDRTVRQGAIISDLISKLAAASTKDPYQTTADRQSHGPSNSGHSLRASQAVQNTSPTADHAQLEVPAASAAQEAATVFAVVAETPTSLERPCPAQVSKMLIATNDDDCHKYAMHIE